MTDIGAIIDLGLEQYRAGDLDQAERLYRQAIATDPRNAMALHLLGMVAVDRGELADGAELMYRALREDAQTPIYHTNLGFALLRLDRREEALERFEAALRLDPGFYDGHLGLSMALLPGEDYYALLARFHEWLRPALYVEIGTDKGNSLSLVRPETVAVAIDPAPELEHPLPSRARLFRMTSDAFFANHDLAAVGGRESFDLAFIDGLHHFEQVLCDFINLERYAGPNSLILIHDCFPISELTSQRHRETGFWTGDVWKVVPLLREARPDLHIFTIATQPSGLAVVTNLDPNSDILPQRREELTARYMDLPYPAGDVERASRLDLVAADWQSVQERCEQLLRRDPATGSAG